MSCWGIKVLCHSVRNHYVKNQLPRFVRTLKDAEYLNSQNMTIADSEREIARLYNLRDELRPYDEIVSGKRRRKQILKFDIDL